MTLKRLFTLGMRPGRGGFFRSDRQGHDSALFLAVVMVFLVSALVTWTHLDRSEVFLRNVMAEKGKMLLLALEGGVRSGTRTYTGLRFQYFLEELGNREDVCFISVVMPDGTIVAHSNPERLGESLMDSHNEMTPETIAALTAGGPFGWMITDMEGTSSFVIYAAFPEPGRSTPSAPGMARSAPYIFLGLSTVPLEQGRIMDRKRALLYGGGVLLVGLLLVVCVYAMARMRASGRGQREAEALVDELALHLPDGLLLLDPRGRVVSMNQSAQRMLLPQGTEGQGAEGIAAGAGGVMSLLPDSLRELVEKLPHEPILDDTELCLDRDGKPLYLSVRGGHVGDADNRLGSLMLLRDMSEVRRLEAEVRRREKLIAVGNLAAGVAHELRNPLSSIKGYATYFSERFPEGSDEREAARVMVRETDRLNRSITDLIGLARPTQVRVRPTPLAPLLEDALRLIHQDAEARRVHTELVCAPDLPPVTVDPDRVRQVLLNLCINALDAMPEGGTLRLRLFADPEKGTDPENAGQICVDVTDTGTGIAPEHLTHIFDPYFTTKGHGTGLGLPTVHKIMEAHGGGISVSSVPGQGTTFRLVFFTELMGGTPA